MFCLAFAKHQLLKPPEIRTETITNDFNLTIPPARFKRSRVPPHRLAYMLDNVESLDAWPQLLFRNRE